MEVGDIWGDADLVSVFLYLYRCRHLQIPPEWKESWLQLCLLEF